MFPSHYEVINMVLCFGQLRQGEKRPTVPGPPNPPVHSHRHRTLALGAEGGRQARQGLGGPLIWGGGAVGGPPKKLREIAGNCGKLRFLVKEIALGLIKFLVSLKLVGEKGAKNYKFKQSQNPAEKIFHVFGVILTIFD